MDYSFLLTTATEAYGSYFSGFMTGFGITCIIMTYSHGREIRKVLKQWRESSEEWYALCQQAQTIIEAQKAVIEEQEEQIDGSGEEWKNS